MQTFFMLSSSIRHKKTHWRHFKNPENSALRAPFSKKCRL